MIETEISILINRKSDEEVILQKIIESKIQNPIYIREYENHYQIDFSSDYEEWELETKILDCFPEYEFTTELDRGRKEIRMQLARYQSEFSSDGWGRRIENPLDETKYLIKKSNNKSEKFNSKIKVLFNDIQQNYFINIVGGKNKISAEKGFLLLNEYKNEIEVSETNIIKDKLYKTPIEAFQSGYNKMQELVIQDYKDFIENKKRELREEQKVPRKIIRDFINSCNKSESEIIFKNIDQNIVFEERINWETKLKIEGINELKEYFKSPNQEFCSRNLKIRSTWYFNLPIVTIGIKFFPKSAEDKKMNLQEYRQIKFELKDKKIISITEEK